jgi:MFS family permease
MYALSPVFGWLADRLGPPRVLVGASVLLLGAAVTCAVAPARATGLVVVGLVLLGLGWSAGLIAGSALVTASVPVPQRPGVQGLVDVAMNVSGAVGGIAGGVVVAMAAVSSVFGVSGDKDEKTIVAALRAGCAVALYGCMFLFIQGFLREGKASSLIWLVLGVVLALVLTRLRVRDRGEIHGAAAE